MPSKPKPKTTRKAKTTTTKKTRARSYNVGGQVASAKAERPQAVAAPNARKASNNTLTKSVGNMIKHSNNFINRAAARRANFNQSQGMAPPQELINAFNASQRGNAGKSTFTPSQRQLQQAQAGIKGTVPKRQIQQKMLDQQALRMQQQAVGGRQQQGKYGFANPKLDQRFGQIIQAQNAFGKQLTEKYKGQPNAQLTAAEKRKALGFDLRRLQMDLQRPDISAENKSRMVKQLEIIRREMGKLGGSGRGGSRTTGRPSTRSRPPRPPAGLGTGPTRNRPVRGRGVKPTTRPRPRPTPTRRTPRSRSRFMGR